jgi:hypothetical protein
MPKKRTKQEYRANISSPKGEGVKFFCDFLLAMLLDSSGLRVASWRETGVNIDNKHANTRFFAFQWMRFSRFGSGCPGHRFRAGKGGFRVD